MVAELELCPSEFVARIVHVPTVFNARDTWNVEAEKFPNWLPLKVWLLPLGEVIVRTRPDLKPVPTIVTLCTLEVAGTLFG
jgi:hypothetical protein